jgi:hypothetical protein
MNDVILPEGYIRLTVPLCRDHHQQLHQAGNEVAW